MYGAEKSDNVILPKKQANNGPTGPAERVEGRALTKGSPHEPVTAWTQSQTPVSPGLMRVRQVGGSGESERLFRLMVNTCSGQGEHSSERSDDGFGFLHGCVAWDSIRFCYLSEK